MGPAPSRRAVLASGVGAAAVLAAAGGAALPAQAATGATGSPDAPAAVHPRGTVDRGAWATQRTYALGDRVTHAGHAWVALRSCTGVAPSPTTVRWVRV